VHCSYDVLIHFAAARRSLNDETSNDRLDRLLTDARISPLPASVRRNLAQIAHVNHSSSAGGDRANVFVKLREIVAELIHDSYGSIAIAGARSAAIAARDVVHRWDDHDLVLTIPLTEGPSASEIHGQVFGPNEANWSVSISFADDIVDETTSTDVDGSFSFSVAAHATFTVVLTDDSVVVRCGPISLDANR
jgi:hypothetical protein